MPHRVLPVHPDLGQLKQQAKDLLHAAKAENATALERLRTLPSLAGVPAKQLAGTRPALHDAQSVIAREYGFPSWKALREHIETLALTLDQALHEFVHAATDGRSERARRLLALHPELPRASLHAALVLGDAAQAEIRLARDPSQARRPGGPRDWEPLLYLCHTSLADADGLVAIARRLFELGADPTARFPWLHHGVRRPALWGAMLVTRSLSLAGLLLEKGADLNDGVTLPLLASGNDTAGLDFLLARGADPNQRWATDGSATLYAVLQWGGMPGGARWLLEHGADPDPVFDGNGESPLHVVAKRWDVPMAEMLVERGADVSRRRADGRTPYAVAELSGNRAVADWLLKHGASADLDPVDRLVATCSRGDRAAAEAMLARRPALRNEIGAEHYVALHRAAERGDIRVLDALLACGFDPNRGDEEVGKTALHSAAMAGQLAATRLLLAHGASTEIRDREFNGTPLVWAADGFRSHKGDADHVAVGRLLLDAGSPAAWHLPSEEPSEAVLEIIDQWRRAASEQVS